MWNICFNEFAHYHKNKSNIIYQLFTISMSIVCIINILRFVSIYHSSLSYLFYLFHYFNMEIKDFVTMIIYYQMLHMMYINDIYINISVLVTCIALQALSYIDEKAYISQYWCEKKFIEKNMLHTIYLGSFIIKLALEEVFIPKSNIQYIHMNNNDHSKIKAFVLSKIKTNDITYHWWYNDLHDDVKIQFESIANNIKDKFETGLNIDHIYEMNEVYVSANNKKEITSDAVFYTKHIDGPFFLFPFCSVYRCIYSINPNKNISTHLENTRTSYTLTEGDCLCFDFNRDIHHIENNGIHNIEPRVTLKIHFVTYPKKLKCFGILLKNMNAKYDKNARNLFLYTISPKTFKAKIMANVILFTTKFTYLTEYYIGFRNIFLFMCYLLCRVGIY